MKDPATRDLLTALARILAFSDHVHVALNLMGEDVRALEEAYGDPTALGWNDQIEDPLDDWLMSTPVASSKVH